jgi:hypothetical protein
MDLASLAYFKPGPCHDLFSSMSRRRPMAEGGCGSSYRCKVMIFSPACHAVGLWPKADAAVHTGVRS